MELKIALFDHPLLFDALPREECEYPHKPHIAKFLGYNLLLIVWAYLHSNLPSELRKTRV